MCQNVNCVSLSLFSPPFFYFFFILPGKKIKKCIRTVTYTCTSIYILYFVYHRFFYCDCVYILRTLRETYMQQLFLKYRVYISVCTTYMIYIYIYFHQLLSLRFDGGIKLAGNAPGVGFPILASSIKYIATENSS